MFRIHWNLSVSPTQNEFWKPDLCIEWNLCCVSRFVPGVLPGAFSPLGMLYFQFSAVDSRLLLFFLCFARRLPCSCRLHGCYTKLQNCFWCGLRRKRALICLIGHPFLGEMKKLSKCRHVSSFSFIRKCRTSVSDCPGFCSNNERFCPYFQQVKILGGAFAAPAPSSPTPLQRYT